MTVAAGSRLGPYEIVAPLGAGGMGEVWRARDTRLGRDVAIKVLRAEVAGDPERVKRFEKEARTVASLSHPNILALYDVGSHEGAPYLVTELLEGQTLAERIRSGDLTVAKAVELGIQIAHGLAAAHEHGIVHRDLKPGNVFVTRDGVVKILDFGLARLTHVESGGWDPTTASTETGLTGAHTVLGTVGYMAPEQVRGQPADHRSDIFAFGCVLYEMLGAERAFRGDSSPDVAAAILKDDPVPLPASVPSALDTIIRRCLEKRPVERFSSAHDVALALEATSSAEQIPGRAGVSPSTWEWLRSHRAAASGTGAVLVVLAAAAGAWLWKERAAERPTDFDPKRVVVAAFENRTGDAALGEVGLQVLEALTRDLSHVKEANLATNPLAGSSGASASSGALAARGDPLRDLAVITKAGLVVTGAYYLQGEQLEFHARLVDPWHGKVLHAAEPVRGTRADPSDALEELGQRVAGAVAWTVDPFIGIGVELARPPRYDALAEFRMAFAAFGSDFPAAEAHFERAIAVDPDFVVARVMLSWTFLNMDRLSEAAEQIGELRSRQQQMTHFERLLTRWMVAVLEGRWLEALSALREMTTMAPASPWLRLCFGETQLYTNRPAEAIETLTGLEWAGFGVGMAPLPRLHLAQAMHATGDYEGQLRVAREGLEVYPDELIFFGQQAGALAALGRLRELDSLMQEYQSLSGSQFYAPAEALFEAARELRAHGHREASIAYANRAADSQRQSDLARWNNEVYGEKGFGLEMLGERLVWAERWEEARAAFQESERLLGDGGALYRCKGFLGSLAARRGGRAEAARIAEELRQISAPPGSGLATYARAQIAAQLGDKEGAVALLQEAAAKGAGGLIAVLLHADIDFEPVRDYPPFQELIRPKG